MLWLLLSIACTASRFHLSPTLPAPVTRPGMSKKLGEDTQLAQLAKTDPNWPYSRLTKKTGGEAGQRSASGRWQLPLQNLFHLPSSLHLLCLYLNPLLFPFSPASPWGREEAAGQCLNCWPGSVLVNCTMWVTSYFFFSIYIKVAEESVHTDWCFLNLGTQLCLFQDQPSCNFANWFLFHISTTFKVPINIPTIEFNYSKTNMLLSVNPDTLHFWKMLFQAKKASTHKNVHDAFSINYFCYVELCFHVAFCYK